MCRNTLDIGEGDENVDAGASHVAVVVVDWEKRERWNMPLMVCPSGRADTRPLIDPAATSTPAASNPYDVLNAAPAGRAGATTAFLQYGNQDSCHGFGKWRNLTRSVAASGESVGLLVPISADEVVIDGAEASVVEHDPVIAAADRVSPPFIVDAPYILNLLDPVAAFALDQANRLPSVHQNRHQPGLVYGS